MGNSKSCPTKDSVSAPRGDILGPPRVFNRYHHIRVEPPKYGTKALQVIEPAQVPVIPDARPPTSAYYNMSNYKIWQDHANKIVRPELMDQFQANIERHAREEYDLEKRIHQIRLVRDKAESDMLSKKVLPQSAPSLQSLCNFAKRYARWPKTDEKLVSSKTDRPELTNDMLNRIASASQPNPPREVLVQIDGVDISRKDIYTLTGLNWLNDEIINAYMFLIVTRGKKAGHKSVYAFNTFFYPKLRESGYASVRRWTRRVDIFSYDFLLAPIHLGNHWCLAVVDFTTKTISYYDSLGGGPNGCCDTLLDYLKSESNDKRKQDFDDENWRLINSYSDTGIPKQENCSDCGVFACTFAEYLTRKAKLEFSQKDMSYFRMKMIYELITKELLQ